MISRAEVKAICRAALVLCLASIPMAATAQAAVVVGCEIGDVVLENTFVPNEAIGPESSKVLPLHMVLTRPGVFGIEFRAPYPFTLYAYRYDVELETWRFLESSARSRLASDRTGKSFQYWDTRIEKDASETEDYLFQLQPDHAGQQVAHRITHVRRTRSCE